MRLVTLSPSVPASGELLTMNDNRYRRRIDRLRLPAAYRRWDRRRCRPRCPWSVRQWRRCRRPRPPPAGVRSMQRKGDDLGDTAISISLPSPPSTFTAWLGLMLPEVMRPVMMRPSRGWLPKWLPIMRNGPSSTVGRRDVAQDQVEQRLHALVLRTFRAIGHPALLGRTT